MKKLNIFILFALTMLTSTGTVQAALTDNGDGTVTDDDSNLMWLQDVNYAKTSGYDSDGYMTWNDAMTWAGNLVFAGHDDWRLPATLQPDPSCSDQAGGVSGGYNCVGSEMGHMYYIEGINDLSPGPFMNIKPLPYWSSTDYAPDPINRVWAFGMGAGYGRQIAAYKSYASVAWAVRDIVDSKPQCSNGKDDDGDGKIDFPADPGCKDANDNDETDEITPIPEFSMIAMPVIAIICLISRMRKGK